MYFSREANMLKVTLLLSHAQAQAPPVATLYIDFYI